jgi:hypothetical protein
MGFNGMNDGHGRHVKQSHRLVAIILAQMGVDRHSHGCRSNSLGGRCGRINWASLGRGGTLIRSKCIACDETGLGDSSTLLVHAGAASEARPEPEPHGWIEAWASW